MRKSSSVTKQIADEQAKAVTTHINIFVINIFSLTHLLILVVKSLKSNCNVLRDAMGQYPLYLEEKFLSSSSSPQNVRNSWEKLPKTLKAS